MVYIELSGGRTISDKDVDVLVNAISRKLTQRALPAAGVRIKATPVSAEEVTLHEGLKAARARQIQAGNELRDLVTQAREKGISWEDVADVLGIAHTTLVRQYRDGGPIVAARGKKEA